MSFFDKYKKAPQSERLKLFPNVSQAKVYEVAYKRFLELTKAIENGKKLTKAERKISKSACALEAGYGKDFVQSRSTPELVNNILDLNVRLQAAIELHDAKAENEHKNGLSSWTKPELIAEVQELRSQLEKLKSAKLAEQVKVVADSAMLDSNKVLIQNFQRERDKSLTLQADLQESQKTIKFLQNQLAKLDPKPPKGSKLSLVKDD